MGIQFSFTREDLSKFYEEACARNPLLFRMETELKIINWSAEEIRTAQLLAALQSNASLTDALKSSEQANQQMAMSSKNGRL